ncbi:LPS assembly lipoprotein LptE [Shimia isoporae]|nr:LPS assembly lipoprotein LptE [Shimia isoporae]
MHRFSASKPVAVDDDNRSRSNGKTMNRRGFLLLAAAGAPALAGCGFEPVYGTSGAADGLLGQVVMDAPANNNASYLLVRELEDRLGRTSTGAYGLSHSIKTRRRAVGKTVAQVTSRFDIFAEVTYALRDSQTKKVLTSGKASSFVGYSASGSTVSELAAEEDAYERLMIVIADRIVADLQAYATKNPL